MTVTVFKCDQDTRLFLINFSLITAALTTLVFKLSFFVNVLNLSCIKPFKKLAIRASYRRKHSSVASGSKANKALLVFYYMLHKI